MKATPCSIPDVLLLQPKRYDDTRGFFFESYNRATFESAVGYAVNFVQDNHSRSVRHVLRGLHYQLPRPQGKLVRAVSGEIFDVAVDMRQHSPSFGQWTGAILSDQNQHQLWIPEGFAHGFLVLSEVADVLYKTTDYYEPGAAHAVRWDDPRIGIQWPFSGNPVLSANDAAAVAFSDAAYF